MILLALSLHSFLYLSLYQTRVGSIPLSTAGCSLHTRLPAARRKRRREGERGGEGPFGWRHSIAPFLEIGLGNEVARNNSSLSLPVQWRISRVRHRRKLWQTDEMRFETRVRLKSSGNPVDWIELHIFEIPIGVFSFEICNFHNCKTLSCFQTCFFLYIRATDHPSILKLRVCWILLQCKLYCWSTLDFHLST